MFERTLNERQSRIDWLMLSAVIALMSVGVLFIYSATLAQESAGLTPWYNRLWFRQLVWYLAGAGAAAAICLVDYRALARWALVAYGVSLVLLLFVLFFGATRYGARRWIDFGPVSLQPSEFAKLAFIFALAHFLSRPLDELRSRKIFLLALAMMGAPFLMIMKEPDLGSALIFIPVGLTMLFAAGVPVRYINTLLGGASVLVVLILVDILFLPLKWQIPLEDYQKRRLYTYFGVDGAPANATPQQRAEARRVQRDYSYNVEQALISVGSGGLLGKGWCQGTQNALGFLPRAVAHNDFIFSVLAEEKGFMGSATVVALYSVVLFTGLRVAGQARDRLGKLLAVGVVAMLFSHIFINIGMNIRLMPVTGVPLPLLSYGGSSVLCSLIAIGILQNIYIHRRS